MSDLFDDKGIAPMLMHETDPFDSDECIYELKLDGIRCLAYLDKGSVTLRNKRDKDVTDIYPELNEIHQFANDKCILDGELVVFIDGKPDFYALQKRSLMTNEFKIKLARQNAQVEFVAYDIIYYRDRAITDLPLMERKKLLSKTITEGQGLSISRYVDGCGIDFFQLVKDQGLEGIVAKRMDSYYRIGKRTRDWLKIKVMQDEELTVCGYQADENGDVKDLILAERDEDGVLQYRGKVYLGVSKEDRRVIAEFALKNNVSKPWFSKFDNVVWLKPKLVGTVKYMTKTPSGGMRQPVWKGLRTD